MKLNQHRVMYVGTLAVLLVLTGCDFQNKVRRVWHRKKETVEFLKPRDGRRIYMALFGQPATDCVQVPNYQDQIIPKIDYGIFLEVLTCPKEMERIAKLRPYEIEKVATPGTEEYLSWFTPASLGDSVWVWRAFDEEGNGQKIYLSEDSTHFYCADILD